jgi:uncharacterized protein
MTSAHQNTGHTDANPRELVKSALLHLDHVLPAQAPIQDFVHHNTLHGYQHLPFEEALAASESLTGINAYLPKEQFRSFYRQGRINDADIFAALGQHPQLEPDKIVCRHDELQFRQKDLCRIAMLYDINAISRSEFNWRIEEQHSLDLPQPDVPEHFIRHSYNADSGEQKAQDSPVRCLWDAICGKLALASDSLHPEHLHDLTLEQTEQWLNSGSTKHPVHEQTRTLATALLDKLFTDVGDGISLRGLILALTGEDMLDAVRPKLLRICASALDEGVAAWTLPDRSALGLYGVWRKLAAVDVFPFLHELPDWQQLMSELPEDPIDAIIQQLNYFDIPLASWEGYLRRLALELPGWAGMINWRQQHPQYSANGFLKPDMADYLAIRLTLDRLWLNQRCRNQWKIEAKLNLLRAYFGKNLSELLVRHSLYQGELPEYLNQQAQALTLKADSERQCREEWQQLADLIFTWRNSPLAEQQLRMTVFNTGWRLFLVAQYLGLTASAIGKLDKTDLLAMLEVIDAFNSDQRSQAWLCAYEQHYRDEFFKAVNANRNRGRWAKREARPVAQIIFCMDEREESFRRHLEEHNPALETLGAAGFFGVAMNYKALDDTKVSPLCPIVVIPAHEVREQPSLNGERSLNRHRQGLQLNRRVANFIYHGLRHNPLVSWLIINISAPFVLLSLFLKLLLPIFQAQWLDKLVKATAAPVDTRLAFTSSDSATAATPEHPRLGFLDAEQIDRVAGFLKVTGLTYGFARLIVLMGHGSISQNNPHLAAYDCGACSGRHGGPNARLFAAMANRPEVRKGLSERNIHIPEDTWFIGAEHNTCNEDIDWFDLHEVPPSHLEELTKLQKQLTHGQRMSAHERCRRLASAPRNPELKEALAHIRERSADFSQARPELGHATNAAAVIGRRSITQGAFFDRRAFLISYDPTQDPDGKTVEGILLNVGPVGAGISLEYYFSTVNNERLGCSTKVPHNIVGQFGVMEGASSDLRTGLPRQMIEIHEAMRLQILVEAKTSILEQIYARQESLRELIAGGWVHLSAVDPDDGAIYIFERGKGFAMWQPDSEQLPIFATSQDCYQGQSLPVSPTLIQQPEAVNA